MKPSLIILTTILTSCYVVTSKDLIEYSNVVKSISIGDLQNKIKAVIPTLDEIKRKNELLEQQLKKANKELFSVRTATAKLQEAIDKAKIDQDRLQLQLAAGRKLWLQCDTDFKLSERNIYVLTADEVKKQLEEHYIPEALRGFKYHEYLKIVKWLRNAIIIEGRDGLKKLETTPKKSILMPNIPRIPAQI
ncbi:uncharacterized protein LOC115626507 [Scaptodrosophila lebanonensis]|uniref:Uncharacterized protein LOC115626507 n=1 Tax=Drosophila lebanonensis TaxID=7225 RepID=A0A6J2TNX9_DROLE|nr:uncharacterized protein LOC115626507 [Scaptodrosophila lebanonensis]